MTSKACTKCGEVKGMEEFYAKKGNKKGRDGWCKSCGLACGAAYRAANPDKVKACSAAYYAANSGMEKARCSAYYAANPEKMRARAAIDIETLAPRYVANLLSIPAADLTPELLALKREQLETHRLAKQVKQYLKEIKA